jgi:hypothetical protein
MSTDSSGLRHGLLILNVTDNCMLEHNIILLRPPISDFWKGVEGCWASDSA